MTKTFRTALAIFAAAVLTTWACSHDHNNPNAPDPVAQVSTTAGGTASNPTPVTNPSPAAGVTVDVIQSTFDPDRCTQLTVAPYNGLTQLVHKVHITNNSGMDIYSKAAIFHSDKAGCGATADNPGGAEGLVTGDVIIKNGKDGTTTYTFPIPQDACGAWQLDDTWRPSNTFVIGKVINSGKDCPSCEAFNVSLDITGSGPTRTLTAHFKAKGNKKLHVEFGDGASADLANGESTTHTWGPGSFTVTATLSSDGLTCPQTYSVTVQQEATCRDLNVQLAKCPEAASVHSASVVSTYNVCLQGSWNQPPTSGSLNYGDSSSDTVNTPFSKTHGYAQTGSTQNFTATLTVVRGQLSCPASVPVVVPPKQETCDDYPKPNPPTFGGALDLSNKTATQVTVTSGTVSPAGGSFNPNVPATVNRPAYGSTGSFSTDYSVTVPYGPENLQCTAKFDHQYSIDLPPQDCPKVNTWTIKNNRSDDHVYTIVIVTDFFHPGSSIVETFNLGPGASTTFTGFNGQTLYAFFALPRERGGTEYDYADKATSGQCGVEAAWLHDASLSVSCGCSAVD